MYVVAALGHDARIAPTCATAPAQPFGERSGLVDLADLAGAFSHDLVRADYLG